MLLLSRCSQFSRRELELGEMLSLYKPGRSLSSPTDPWQHHLTRCRLGTHMVREFSRIPGPQSARPTVCLTPVNHTGSIGNRVNTPPAHRRIKIHAAPPLLGLLRRYTTIPARISARAFSLSSTTFNKSFKKTSDSMSDDTNGAATSASNWVGHQGAAAFDFRSE